VATAAVHPATPYDIPHVARIQRDTWRAAYAALLPAEVLAALDGEETEQAWEQARASGVTRLFVATEGAFTVGFCSAGFAPADEVADADGSAPEDADTVVLVGTLLVEPRWGRRGHGGRLIATAVHALRNEGATRGVAWLPEADEASGKFYASIGWRPDGTARTLDAAGQPLREIRVSGGLDLTWQPGT
jgi:GNAT superfamily N-acetyltransferase